jgi:hypothetical protein
MPTATNAQALKALRCHTRSASAERFALERALLLATLTERSAAELRSVERALAEQGAA